ncbi:predicted protein [Nematostella vectensis]|uniref:Uncharacterized protein n=1 Tax=Nematostella vectensis TaxID=45351 RepID=A7T688_NEMVE|nr:predicted protein [Nematostella vectensis]|eukprot:XP_001620615.1 hypothetical protein NEMVEDRAFT_v1g222913 [Nematostella vectensis]
MGDIDSIMTVLRQWYHDMRKEEEARKEAEKFEQEDLERKASILRPLRISHFRFAETSRARGGLTLPYPPQCRASKTCKENLENFLIWKFMHFEREALRLRLEEAKQLEDDTTQKPDRGTTSSPDQQARDGSQEADSRPQRQKSGDQTDSSNKPQRTLSASEKRAIDAEKRAQWRQQRMRELEEDALKAQIVIAQVKAMSASSLESLPLASPDANRKSPSSSDNEAQQDSGLRRTSNGSTNKST